MMMLDGCFWGFVSYGILGDCNCCLPAIDRVSLAGAQGGKATSQNEAEKQDSDSSLRHLIALVGPHPSHVRTHPGQ